MYARCLVLIATFQLLHTTIAVWNPYRPLHLVDIQTRRMGTFTKIFPLEIPSNIKPFEVYNNAIHYAFCPNPLAIKKNCNYGDLAGKPASKASQLPQQCTNPIIYNVVPYLNDLTQVQKICIYNQKAGHIFHFVYLLCQFGDEIPKGEKIIYKVCYRDAEKQTLLASAAIEKPSLLKMDSLRDERTYPFAFDDTHYYNPYTQDIINASIFLYNQTSNYTPEFVLPPVLFPFAHQRTTLYHQMNLAPMESTVKEGWNVCLDKLVDKLSGYQESINVYAGLLGVLQDAQGNDLYLGVYKNKMEIPIPGAFWLMIASQSEYEGVAIIIHNINYSTVERQPNQFFKEEDCNAQVCQNSNLEEILPSPQTPVYITCCWPRAINEHFYLDVRNRLPQF